LRSDLTSKKDELDNANNSSKTMGIENLSIRPKFTPGKHEDEFDTITGNQKPSLGITGASNYGTGTYGSQYPTQSVVDKNIDAIAKEASALQGAQSIPGIPGAQDRNSFNRFGGQGNQNVFNNKYTNNASNITSRNPYNR
jgi:hypothetical protein